MFTTALRASSRLFLINKYSGKITGSRLVSKTMQRGFESFPLCQQTKIPMSIENQITPEFIAAVEKASVYPIYPRDFPTNLVNWEIYEAKIKGREEPARHLIGYNSNYHEGRVSSAVKKWELTQEGLKCTTKSGNIYNLVGHPGPNGDARYVFSRWCSINEAKEVVDVTDQYWDKELNICKLP